MFEINMIMKNKRRRRRSNKLNREFILDRSKVNCQEPWPVDTG
jgi:hypothetical protein